MVIDDLIEQTEATIKQAAQAKQDFAKGKITPHYWYSLEKKAYDQARFIDAEKAAIVSTYVADAARAVARRSPNQEEQLKFFIRAYEAGDRAVPHISSRNTQGITWSFMADDAREVYRRTQKFRDGYQSVIASTKACSLLLNRKQRAYTGAIGGKTTIWVSGDRNAPKEKKPVLLTTARDLFLLSQKDFRNMGDELSALELDARIALTYLKLFENSNDIDSLALAAFHAKRTLDNSLLLRTNSKDRKALGRAQYVLDQERKLRHLYESEPSRQ